MLVSGVRQSVSGVHIHVTILFQIPFPFRFLQSIVLYSRSACTRQAHEKEGRNERKNERGGGVEEGRERECKKGREKKKGGRERERRGEKYLNVSNWWESFFFFHCY